jgi:hypothetical protein
MLDGCDATSSKMNRRVIIIVVVLALSLGTWTPAASGQADLGQTGAPIAAPAPGGVQYSVQGRMGPSAGGAQSAVSYASVTQVNGLLSQLEAAAKNTQEDLVKMRVERWKTDGSYKKQSLANVDSIQRNLQGALPEMITQVRSAPEDLPASFKLYRNLDALYDVLGTVAESAGAFGSKDDFQSLSNDLSSLEVVRKAFAERIQNLATAKEAEISRLRTDLKAAQAAIPATPPKKTVVDDTEPAKKPPAKKKPAAKKPAITPVPGQTPSNQPAQQTQPPPTQPQQE